MIPPQPVPVRCPQCQTAFNAPVQTIVDVGQQPHLKEALLRGQLNVVPCPNCGARVRLGAPLFYHDPAHQLAVAYIPMELGLSRDDQEKLIGRLSNTLTDSLPPEQRKFYILQPKTALTQQGLIEMILEADGITRDVIEAQAGRVRLLNDLVNAVSQDDKLQELIEANKDTFDYNFFLLIAGAMEDAQAAGDELRARRLAKLRDQLVAVVGVDESPLPEPLPASATFDDLVQALTEAPNDGLVDVVAVNRPRFDYFFFQALTSQIDAAQASGDTAKAQQLTDLRERVLEAVDTVDREMQASLRQGASLLQTILEAEDPQQAVQEHLDEMDDAFLLVLSANIQQAHEQGQAEIAQALEGLYAYILSRLESALPPLLQVVNRLLRLEEPAQRAEVLDMEPSLINDDLAELLDRVAQDADEQGRADLAQHARTIRDEVKARL
ncbi:MAG: CpXC domain-containing protein [Anaerolineae bacterium]|nr:CpXC domain-containing protein [Anaerolineae bacterium]